MEERGRKERQGWGLNQKKGVWMDGSMAESSVRGISRSLCVLGLEHDFVLCSLDRACVPIVPHRIRGKYPAYMKCLGKTGQAIVHLPLAWPATPACWLHGVGTERNMLNVRWCKSHELALNF